MVHFVCAAGEGSFAFIRRLMPHDVSLFPNIFFVTQFASEPEWRATLWRLNDALIITSPFSSQLEITALQNCWPLAQL